MSVIISRKRKKGRCDFKGYPEEPYNFSKSRKDLTHRGGQGKACAQKDGSEDNNRGVGCEKAEKAFPWRTCPDRVEVHVYAVEKGYRSYREDGKTDNAEGARVFYKALERRKNFLLPGGKNLVDEKILYLFFHTGKSTKGGGYAEDRGTERYQSQKGRVGQTSCPQST
jgi:hypothetical protein